MYNDFDDLSYRFNYIHQFGVTSEVLVNPSKFHEEIMNVANLLMKISLLTPDEVTTTKIIMTS